MAGGVPDGRRQALLQARATDDFASMAVPLTPWRMGGQIGICSKAADGIL